MHFAHYRRLQIYGLFNNNAKIVKKYFSNPLPRVSARALPQNQIAYTMYIYKFANIIPNTLFILSDYN